MPQSVIYVLAIQSVLMMVTSVMLFQPPWLTRLFPGMFKSKAKSRLNGIILLAVTFCWAVVVGVVLSLNQISVRI